MTKKKILSVYVDWPDKNSTELPDYTDVGIKLSTFFQNGHSSEKALWISAASDAIDKFYNDHSDFFEHELSRVVDDMQHATHDADKFLEGVLETHSPKKDRGAE